MLNLSERQSPRDCAIRRRRLRPKIMILSEELLLPWAAMKLRRPVKWIEDRLEHFVATTHERGQIHDAEIALTNDGRILGVTGCLPARHRRLRSLRC